MAAMQKLLIDALVAAAAVAGRQLRDNREPVMFLALLSSRGLVAVETADAALRVPAHLVLVDDGILLVAVALGALAGRPNGSRRRLVDLDARPRAVDEERADNQRKRDDDGDEDGPEGHAVISNRARVYHRGIRFFERGACRSLRSR